MQTKNFQALLDAVPDAMLILNTRAELVLANAQVEALCGWPREELLGCPVELLIPSRFRAAYAEHLAACLAEPTFPSQAPSRDFRALRKDGTEVPVEIRLSSLETDQGQFVCAVFRDLTEFLAAEAAQRQVTDALRHANQRVTTILESITDATFSLDREWRFVYVNQQAEHLLSRHREELLGRSVWDEFPRAVGTAFDLQYRHAVASGESVHFEQFYPPLERWFEVHAYPSDEGLSVYFRDINERKQSELALLQSERNYRFFLEEASDAILIADADWRWVTVNPQACALLGYPEEELRGMHALDLVAPEDRDARPLRLDLLEDHQRLQSERLLIRKDGTRVAAEISSRILPDGRFQAIVRDITQRKEAETALRQSEERFRRLVEANIIGIFFWSADGAVTYANDALLEIIGYNRDDLEAGQICWMSLTPPEYHTIDVEGLAQLRSVGSLAPFEKEYFRKDGSRVPVLIGAASWDGTGNEGIAFVLDLSAQKLAEASFHRSREWLELAHSAGGIGAWEWDFHSDRMTWSDSYYQLLGLNPQTNPCYAGWIEQVYPGDLELVERNFASIRKGGPFISEYRMVRTDGAVRWHYCVGICVLDAAGNAQRISGVSLDVTERKSAEAALRESEERYRSLVNNATDLIYSHDLQGRILSINRAGEELTGYREDQLLQMSLLDLVAPECWSLLHQRAAERVEHGNLDRTTCELELVAQDGRRVPVEISSAPFLQNGEIVALQGIARDTSARRAAEAALRASEARFRAICEASPLGMFLSDTAGKCLYTNPTMLRQLGLPPGGEVGSGWTAALHPEDHEPVMAEWAAAIRERRGFEVHERVVHSDGSMRHLVVRVEPVREGTELLGFVGCSVDDTDRIYLEEQLRQAQKMEAVGRLAGGVAHDFNNMLAVINGYSELCLGSMAPQNPLHRPLGEIKKAGERAATLTRQLLAFSRKQMLRPEVLELNQVIADLHTMLSRLIGEDILLGTRLAADLDRISADPGQIEQVILNLAVNARDAMPRGGRLVIATRNVVLDAQAVRSHTGQQPGAYVLLEVSDTGCGMTPEVQTRIFEPFFTTKGPGEGTGLGLATVYGIVTQSDGHLEVESVPGCGSTFRIYLPRVRAAVKTDPSPTVPPEIPQGAETILLVEDEQMVRTLVRTVLESCGYRVLEAGSPEELDRVQELHSGAIDLLLTDVVMPTCSGPEVSELLRKRYPDLKVLYMSGYTDDAVVRHGVCTAEAAFIQKPFSPVALAQKVRELLN